jgi:hypothetical protein
MSNRLMISVATAALIAGTGLASAQGMGGGREGGSAGASGGASVQQSAPAAPSSGAASHEGASGSMKSSQSEQKSGAATHSAQQEKSGSMGEKSTTQEKSAQDTKGDHSKSMSSQNEKGSGKDMKAEGREDRNGKDMKAEGREDRNGKDMKAEGRDHDRSNTTVGAKEGERTQTTGQAGAGAKLTTEQRTKVTTVIRDQHIAPVTNINFTVSVGTRVPREVGFHPLPAEIVTIYPDWRGYEFFLARNEIVVVDPRTLEIVAVLPA